MTTTVSESTTQGERRRQVCLFGTSANPPTGDGGHVGIVKALSMIKEIQESMSTSNTSKDGNDDDAVLYDFDEIRVLPVYQHTFASKRNKLVQYDHRVKMCQLAFDGLSKVQVSTAEQRSFERMSINLSEEEKCSLRVGTADLLDMLMEEEPDTDFSFCLGADTFLDLTEWKWKRSKDVIRLLGGRLIVLYRKGVVVTPKTPSEGNNASTEDNKDSNDTATNDKLLERVHVVNEKESAKVVLLNVPSLMEVSSSAVRVCKDENELLKMVPSTVLEYMKSNHLYAFDEEKD